MKQIRINKMKRNKVISMFLSTIMLLGLIAATPITASTNVTGTTSFPNDGYVVDYTITNAWNNGQNINVTITNTGTKTIEGWMLAYDDFCGSISNIWDAKTAQTDFGHEYVRNAGHNANIEPGQSKSFGYSLDNPTGVPNSLTLCQERVAKSNGYDAVLNVINDWGPAFNGEIILTNTTDKPIEWWEFTFDSSFTITQIVASWSATFNDNGNGNYTFKGTHTGIIAPNSSVALGFQATKNGTPEFYKEKLTEVVVNNSTASVTPDSCRLGGTIAPPTNAGNAAIRIPNGNELAGTSGNDATRRVLNIDVKELIAGTPIKANDIYGIEAITWGPNKQNRQMYIDVRTSGSAWVASPQFHGSATVEADKLWATMVDETGIESNPTSGIPDSGRTETNKLVYMNQYGGSPKVASNTVNLAPFVSSTNPEKFDVRIRANADHISYVTSVALLGANGEVLGRATYSSRDANGTWNQFAANIEDCICGDCIVSYDDVTRGTIETLITDGTIEVVQDEYGNFRAIDGTFINGAVNSENDAARALNAVSSLFSGEFEANSSNITVQSVNEGEASEANFYRYSSEVNGVPVLGSQVILETDGNGIVKGLHSSYNDKINKVITEPNTNITSQYVSDLALYDSSSPPTYTTETKLFIYAMDKKTTPALVWRVIIEDANKIYYVYANGTKAGQILGYASNSRNWESEKIIAKDLLDNDREIDVVTENNQFRLYDSIREIETWQMSSDVIQGNISTGPSPAAVSAHFNKAFVYDYYKDKLDRNSFDDNGAKIVSRIGYPGENAYWISNFQRFQYGDQYESALDIVGHEYTHAVINYIIGGEDAPYRNLGYLMGNEADALNEAYADIMGSIIEGKTGDDFWIIGEDKTGNNKDTRDMRTPKHMDEFVEHDKNNLIENWELNSGIFSYAVYLMMTDGETGRFSNDNWAEIFYRSLYRLTDSATFLDARAAVVTEANRYGFNHHEQEAIKNAFNTVGIVNPESIRIVLEWGETPRDLDSHLIGPGILNSDERFHTWYMPAYKTYYTDGTYNSSNLLPVAQLDYDDVESYGPEVTTIRVLTPGVYNFFVHDYSNRGLKPSTHMAKSGATVTVYKGYDKVVPPFTIDPLSEGTLWEVFKLEILDSDGNFTVTGVNNYTYESIPALIGQR